LIERERKGRRKKYAAILIQKHFRGWYARSYDYVEKQGQHVMKVRERKMQKVHILGGYI
jgi:hypothetical protein